MSYSKKTALPKSGDSVHLVGVLGAGMLPLAAFLISRGCKVSGSDLRAPERDLPRGLDFSLGHDPSRLDGASLCVFSLAVPEDDPELRYAAELGIPTVSRPTLLGAAVGSFPLSIAIAGSHGKSSATAMTAAALAPLRPTVLCGADIGECGFVSGSSDLLIYEACEYRDAFLSTEPTVAVLLNLELDHTDYFADISALERSFSSFAASARRVIYNADDARLARISEGFSSVGFGGSEGADYRCRALCHGRFSLEYRGALLGELGLSVLGDFNIMNATAAVAVAGELGLSWEGVRRALSEYRGIPRRLELLGSLRGLPVIYDYAHHPAEIAAGIAALRSVTREEISVVFRPHTYTRTASLLSGFIDALGRADRVILLDIYAAREPVLPGISSEALAEAIGDRAVYAKDQSTAAELILGGEPSAVMLMGAGDISELKEKIEKNLDKPPYPC